MAWQVISDLTPPQVGWARWAIAEIEYEMTVPRARRPCEGDGNLHFDDRDARVLIELLEGADGDGALLAGRIREHVARLR